MRAILLAARRGSRLAHHTAERPKCLVEVGAKPLLQWQLEVLHGCGIDDVVAVRGYRREAIHEPGLRTVDNPRWELTNMVASLHCARHELRGDVLVAYTDLLYGESVVRAALNCEAHMAMVADRNWRWLWQRRMDEPLADAESFRMDPEGRVLEIGQRANSLDEIQAQYLGLIRLSPAGSELLADLLDQAQSAPADPFGCGRSFDAAAMTDLLMHLVRQGFALAAIPIDGGWTEVDSPRDLEIAEAMMEEGHFGCLQPKEALR